MKKTKLVVNYDYDFDLYGMISPSKEYTLAWHLNRGLGIRLVKEADMQFEVAGQRTVYISNYVCHCQHYIVRLLRNKPAEGAGTGFAWLLPELKEFDYFLLLQGHHNLFDGPEHRQHLNNLAVIQYFTKIDTANLKNRENLIF